MRSHSRLFVLFLFAVFASAPGTLPAATAEDKAALSALDATFRARVDPDAPAADRERALALIHKVIDRIVSSYIEPFDIRELANFAASAISPFGNGMKPADLAHAAIDTLVRRLDDPYATFDRRRMTTGGRRTGGIGIEATIVDGRLKVIAPLEGSPAQKAGIQPGDLILEIDREPIQGITLSEAMAKIRGPLGSEVLLRILRHGSRKIGLPIERTRYKVRALRHSVLGQFAYIRIAFFGPNTEKLLRQSLAAIQTEMGGVEPQGYIVDLRDNPGGLVGQAILVADAFLERGMIVATLGRDATGARKYDAYRGDFIKGRPIIVLQNEATASASEILSAALKDHRRATIMGTRSYGKGIVQTVYPFGAQGTIKFTTHKYMTAAGIPIHGVGVLPHIIVNGDPRPAYGAAAAPIERCPTAGAAQDKMLGCALLFMTQGAAIEPFLKALPSDR